MYRFKEARNSKNMTQQDVAAFLGITRASYTNIENEKRDPDTQSLIRLANLFDVSIDYLVGLSDRRREDNVSKDAREIVEIYNQLNDSGKKTALGMLTALLENPALRQEGLISSMG